MAELAAAEAVADCAPATGGGAPGKEPTMDELWQLLGRADVIMRELVEAPDREVRERWRAKIGPWLRDVGQAWAHAPTPPSQARPPRPQAGRRV